MVSKIVFLWLAVNLMGLVTTDEEETYCYATESATNSKYGQFATKTAYASAKGSSERDQYEIEGCTPEKIWLLSRHGAIHPTKSASDVLNDLEDLHKQIVDLTEPLPLCVEDKNLLLGENGETEWLWDTNRTAYPEVLSIAGWTEVQTLAHDYKNIFPDLFDTSEKVLFRHTTEFRNNESTFGFAAVLFDNYNEDFTDVDKLLKFYDGCEKWNKESETESDLSKFEKSEIFKNTIKGISDRLGSTLTFEKIKNIWDMCRYDKAWNNGELSPWCVAFSSEHINVLEYHEDIELYYKTGQGEKINSHLACRTVVDLLDRLSDTTTDKATVSFADATTIQLFLTALETHIDNETKPSTDSMANMDKRKWKSSEMSPFASNLAIVKYDCTDDKHQIKLFLNQNPLELEWCNEDGVCEFNKFVEHYRSFREADCNEYFCSLTSGNSRTVLGAFAVIVSLILLHLH